MNRTDFDKDNKCHVCPHFGFCQIYWGAECKRQGGNRIPRLKTSSVTTINAVSQNKTPMRRKIDPSYDLNLFEQIKTKRVNWA